MAQITRRTPGNGNSFLRQSGYMEYSGAPAWDPFQGGQHGWDDQPKTYISNQAHVSRPLVCLVLQTPRLFSAVTEQSNLLIGTFKAMMEEHSHQITGFDEELTVEFEATPVGGAGQEQHEVVNVTRAQPNITHSIVEKRGRPFQKFLEWWIRFGLMDPETKHPLASVLNIDNLNDMGPDMISATCLYFVPDVLFKFCDRAWLCANMMPHTQGTSTAQRNKRDAQEVLMLEIPFTSIAEVGAGVNLLAERLMARINIGHADPYARVAHLQDYDPIVDAINNTGYARGWKDTFGENQSIYIGKHTNPEPNFETNTATSAGSVTA